MNKQRFQQQILGRSLSQGRTVYLSQAQNTGWAQTWLNNILQADPKNPVKLPIQAVDTAIEFNTQGIIVVLGAALIVATGMVVSSAIRK